MAALIGLTAGCSVLHSSTYDPVFSDSGELAYRRTSVRACTLFDSQSSLSKFRNTTGANGTNGFVFAPGTSIESLDQSASGTNAAVFTGNVLGQALKAFAKP